ncbi:MAG: hypothetical protein RMZ95_004445 [Nostoc sp. DedQUE07]|nr:hypothetical protein [Nostoc sp. DedQUE07]
MSEQFWANINKSFLAGLSTFWLVAVFLLLNSSKDVIDTGIFQDLILVWRINLCSLSQISA